MNYRETIQAAGQLDKGVRTMLKTIALVLLVLWALGFIGFSSAVGSLIHILIVAAVVLFLVDLLSGGRRLA
jgi:uncharacterized membrane protein YtjA (UPF0391 family)